MVCLGRLHHFKFFKGSLSEILLGPFLNTLSHISDEKKISGAIMDCQGPVRSNARYGVRQYSIEITHQVEADTL